MGVLSEKIDFSKMDLSSRDISQALTEYEYVVSEIGEFSEHYHSMARVLLENLPEELGKKFHDDYMRQSIFFLENNLVRLSSAVDHYFESILFELGSSGEFFTSEELTSARRRVARQSEDYLEGDITFEAGCAVCRQSRMRLNDFFVERVGVSLEKAAPDWNAFLILNQVRNAVIHNGSRVDFKFKKAMSNIEWGFSAEVGEPLLIPEREVQRIRTAVNDGVNAIDAQILQRHPIFRRDAIGHFWMARSKWGYDLLLEREAARARP